MHHFRFSESNTVTEWRNVCMLKVFLTIGLKRRVSSELRHSLPVVQKLPTALLKQEPAQERVRAAPSAPNTQNNRLLVTGENSREHGIVSVVLHGLLLQLCTSFSDERGHLIDDETQVSVLWGGNFKQAMRTPA